MSELAPGQRATVVEIVGGRGLYQRLQAMGLRTGTVIRRLAGGTTPGPVIVEVGSAQFAVGFGMAQRIIVELEDGGENPARR